LLVVGKRSVSVSRTHCERESVTIWTDAVTDEALVVLEDSIERSDLLECYVAHDPTIVVTQGSVRHRVLNVS
jgi:hypothetical protein